MHERSLNNFSSEILVAMQVNNIFQMLLLLGKNDFYPDSFGRLPFVQPFKFNTEALITFQQLFCQIRHWKKNNAFAYPILESRSWHP